MIYFRADGNRNVGLGHTMRCLALADGFKELGKECRFLIARDSDTKTLISERGFDVYRLTTGYDRMEEEKEELENLLSGKSDIVIADSYYATEGYFRILKKLPGGNHKLICFDDLMESAPAVDGLINYNLYANKAKYAELYRQKNAALPHLYLGGMYAPFCKRTAGALSEEQRIDKKPGEKHVLLSCGGADPEGVTVGILKALKEKQQNGGFESFVFHIPVGAVNAKAGEIKEMAAGLQGVNCYSHIRAFREFISQMDFAVSAAGSTLYELCMEGIPSISYVLADNQMNGAEIFEQKGLIQSAGDCRNNRSFAEDVLGFLMELSQRSDLDRVRERMKNAVDGLGAVRLAERIIKDFEVI